MTLTVEDLLRRVTREPGRPRMTWYGEGDERVELSGAVLENWVNKTTNLLVEEFDVGPGSLVHVDLPPHWRTAVWVLAAWRAGAGAVLTDAPETHADAVVLVTDRPETARDDVAVIAVALPALARRFDGTLPPGTIDAAAAVMTYADTVMWAPAIDPAAPAIRTRTGEVTHAGLDSWISEDADTWRGRPMLALEPGRDRGAVALVKSLTAALAHGGSLVALAPTLVDALLLDPARMARIEQSERITTTVVPAR